MKLMVVSKRFLIMTGLMVIFFIAWRLYFKLQIGIGALALGSIIFIIILLYKKDVLTLFKQSREKQAN